MDVQEVAGANEWVNSDGGDLDFSAKSAEGSGIPAFADDPGTKREADGDKRQQEADELKPEDQCELQQAR